MQEFFCTNLQEICRKIKKIGQALDPLGLAQRAPKPFATDLLHPNRRALDCLGVHVKATAQAEHGAGKLLSKRVSHVFLQGRAKATKQNGRAFFLNGFDKGVNL